MDIDKFKRFSMCNCLTVRMDRIAKETNPNVARTYTAHLMTIDLFLKLAKPGIQIDVPFKEFWPTQKYIRTYRIPKKVNTFLFSPFNEAWHPGYHFGTDVRYVVPKRLRQPMIKESVRHGVKFIRGRPNFSKQFIENMKALDKKVTKLWNPNKILVLYDNTWAPTNKKPRLDLFNQVAKETLKWPCIQVSEKRPKPKGADRWQHYSNSTYLGLLRQIEKLERK